MYLAPYRFILGKKAGFFSKTAVAMKIRKTQNAIRLTFAFALVSGLGLATPLLGQTEQEKAWSLLESGVSSSKAETRAAAVRTLSVITGDPKAVTLAEGALQDKNPKVREAAAVALGTLKAKSSIPKLKALKNDKSAEVAMAAARALVQMDNPSGYSFFYIVVTGKSKSGEGLIDGEKQEMEQVMHDPKEMSEEAFEAGIGFVPFGGMAFAAFEHIHKEEAKEIAVRIAGVKILAKDPDPLSGQALLGATSDKHWGVRAAAYDALARRGDRSLLGSIPKGMSDESETVKFMAAAAVVQLSSAHPRAGE